MKNIPVTVEREVPDVTDDLAPIGGWSMSRVDPVAELAAFEAAAELQKKMITASIRATKPQDWVEMGGKVYLQSTGVERISPLWGLIFGEPSVTEEKYADGSYSYIVTGPVGSRRTGVFYRGITGGRGSADPFFDAFDEDKPKGFREMPAGDQVDWKRAHRLPPDPLDVRKAAITNWTTRGASMLTGMRGLTSADLKAAGIEGVARVEYGSGGKGGDAAPPELKAEVTKLSNDVLTAVGGDKEAARKLFKEITAGKNFAGMDSPAGIKHQWQIDNARKALEAHPIFGKNPKREPGEE